jgi:hypothetical protein
VHLMPAFNRYFFQALQVIAIAVPILFFNGVAERGFHDALLDGKKLVNRSSHLHDSLRLGVTLAECGKYSHAGSPGFLETMGTIKTGDSLVAVTNTDCAKIHPSHAVENGHSLLIALVYRFSSDNFLSFTENFIAAKFLIIFACSLLIFASASFPLAFLFSTLTGYIAAESSEPFTILGLSLVAHAYSPVLFLLVVSAALFIVRRLRCSRDQWPHQVVWLAIFSTMIFFVSIYRSVDLYAIALACLSLALLKLAIERTRESVALLLFFALAIGLGVGAGKLHTRSVAMIICPTGAPACGRIAAIAIKHSFWHPLVLGLGAPPTPISQKYGFGWKSDLEGLIPARVKDPTVDRLYTKEYSTALRRFYIDAWKYEPDLMIKSYWVKARSLFGIGWPVYLFGASALLIGLLVRDYAVALVALAFCMKSMESTLIYSPYTFLYHHYNIYLTALILLLLSKAAFEFARFKIT